MAEPDKLEQPEEPVVPEAATTEAAADPPAPEPPEPPKPEESPPPEVPEVPPPAAEPAAADRLQQLEAEATALRQQLIEAQLRAGLAEAGVVAKLIPRAVRLVDPAAVLKGGQVDTALLSAEIAAIGADLPGLLAASSDNQPALRLGVPSDAAPDASDGDDHIRRAFGLGKRKGG